ncbi:MAG: hypothetical protein H6850_02525 [Alphaproteobacteria bacterium]|nr:MAG: hypothetical protein H6850_02525 [Alphaproteobacteria bacterium]
MQHPEFYIYTLSFSLFFVMFISIMRKKGGAFFKDKQKQMDNFLETARYLQRVSLGYIMEEKKPDGDLKKTLKMIQDESKQKVKEIQAMSLAEIEEQGRKLKQQLNSRMRIMNSRFINETKEELVKALMEQVKKEMSQRAS